MMLVVHKGMTFTSPNHVHNKLSSYKIIFYGFDLQLVFHSVFQIENFHWPWHICPIMLCMPPPPPSWYPCVLACNMCLSFIMSNLDCIRINAIVNLHIQHSMFKWASWFMTITDVWINCCDRRPCVAPKKY
jgi:hypothetical protein